MTEIVISEVFKRPVLWDQRNKDCHNRDIVGTVCDREQQKSHEEIINVGRSQMYDAESAYSEDATSEIQDSAPTAC